MWHARKLQSTLPTIGTTTVSDCNGSTIFSVEIPASVETIEQSAFSDCDSLVKLTFEAGSKLKIIGSGAFYSNGKLEGVEIPASVESIESNAFYNCNSLDAASRAATYAQQLFRKWKVDGRMCSCARSPNIK